MNYKNILIVILTIFLFVGGPDSNSHRIFQAFWDTGHFILFAGLVWGLLFLPILNKKPLWILWCITTAFCLLLGLSTELLQLFVGRTFSVTDILNDLFGGYLGLLFYTANHKKNQTKTPIATYIFMFVLIANAIRPFLFVTIDHFVSNKNFPILADFETPFELSRWDTNLAKLSYATKEKRHGEKAMKIIFQPGQYPDIALRNFQTKWQNYKWIKFSIYHTQKAPIQIELKIYDRQHMDNGYLYSDRYNKILQLHSGWNDVQIELNKIKHAPRKRTMEMTDIIHFSLFLHDLKKPLVMYLDSLELSK